MVNQMTLSQHQFGEKEYVIQNVKRVPTHANIDDGVTHLTLQLRECEGNIIR